MNAIHKDDVLALFTLMNNTHDKRMYQRYQAVYLHLQDNSAENIAIIIGRSEKTVYNYLNALKAHGIEGLKPGKAPGASYKITPQQREELVQVIVNQLPTNIGFSAKFNWTLGIIVAYIEREWNVTYTQRGVSKLLHALGLSYTQPTYMLAKANPTKQKEFKEKTFPDLKKLLNEEIDYLLFQYETMIRDYQAIQCTWFLKGQQRMIPTYGKHQGVNLIGVLNYENGGTFCVKEEQYDAAAFLRFLQKVLEHYPNGKITMFLDNARIHHAKFI